MQNKHWLVQAPITDAADQELKSIPQSSGSFCLTEGMAHLMPHTVTFGRNLILIQIPGN